jgi:hypothetical protein
MERFDLDPELPSEKVDKENTLKRTHRRNVLIFGFALFTCAARAQVVGTSIFGSVEDESGASLAQAVGGHSQS